MFRYLRLYKNFVAFSISRSMEFRFDFTFRIIMDLTFYIVKIYFFKVIFLHANTLVGWTEPQVLIFVATYLTIDAIQMTLISNNAWILPSLVNKGELDYYLLRPVSSLFFLSFRDFAVNSFINFLMVFGFLVYCIVNYTGEIAPINLFLFTILVINGFLIFYFIRMILILPVFWTHNGRGLEMIFWTMGNFIERPDGIYHGIVRTILTTILPFALVASMPSRVLFGEEVYKFTAHCLIVSFCLFVALIFLWRLALKNYSSASS